MFFERPESPRILENDYLDFFTRVHFASVPLLFVPITLFGLTYSVIGAGVSIPTTLGLFVIGWFAWSLSEYWLHRKLFHWQPGGKWGEQLHFWLHGIHHRWPSDPYRLVMPPFVNLTILVLVATPVLWVAPKLGWGFLAGYTCGYMYYDLMHYYLHHHKPKLAYLKKLKAHHMNHHHNKTEQRFGVSFILWDRVFGTMQ